MLIAAGGVKISKCRRPHHSYWLGSRKGRSINTFDRPQGPREVSTPGPGASTDQTPSVEADLEAHSEQSEEAPETAAQGERSLDTVDNPSSDKENWTTKSMNEEGSRIIAQTGNRAWPNS